jgi:hypothetical protein
MQSLEKGFNPFSITRAPFPEQGQQRFTVMDAEAGEVAVRLLIGQDGKVKRRTYLYGTKKIWIEWSKPLYLFEFKVDPSINPGPWELDMMIIATVQELGTTNVSGGRSKRGGGSKGDSAPRMSTSFKPISYRPAK